MSATTERNRLGASELIAAINRRDWAGAEAAMSVGFVAVDHRRIGFGTLGRSGFFRVWIAPSFEHLPGVTVVPWFYAAESAAVSVTSSRGMSADGVACEWHRPELLNTLRSHGTKLLVDTHDWRCRYEATSRRWVASWCRVQVGVAAGRRVRVVTMRTHETGRGGGEEGEGGGRPAPAP